MADLHFPQNKLAKGNILSQKLSRLQQIVFSDCSATTQHALEYVAHFFEKDQLLEPQYVKTRIEHLALQSNQKLLGAFELVNSSLRETEREINSLALEWADMDLKLKSAQNGASQVLYKTQELQHKLTRNSHKQIISETVLSKFTLSESETKHLTTNTDAVDASFFISLSHLQQIQEDCKVLLMTDHQRLGTEIMEKMTKYEQFAYEKLNRWVLAECRLLKFESPEVTIEMKQGMLALKQRPIFFENCLNEITTIRKSALGRAFQEALMGDSENAFPRPIEFHAHDPIRYIGDMLAWVHQACVGEREMLESLFNLPSSANKRRTSVLSSKSPSALDEISEFQSVEDSLIDILGNNLESVCRPLQVRTKSVLDSELGPITSYKIANLIQFYGQTIQKVMGGACNLCIIINELSVQSYQAFFESLDAQGKNLLKNVQPPHSDLQPSASVKEIVAQLREILLSYDGSIVSKDQQTQDIGNIMKTLMEPLLQLCSLGANEFESIDQAIYMVNCVHFIQTILGTFSFTEELDQIMKDTIEHQAQILIEFQYSDILKQSGLFGIIEAMKSMNPPLSQKEETSIQRIQKAMYTFESFLVKTSVELAGPLHRISSLYLGRLVLKRGFQLFIESYAMILKAIIDPVNKYDMPSSLVLRSVEEVETLLSLNDEI